MPRILLLSAVLSMAASVAVAQETTTYIYDVHGRLTDAERSTGPDTSYTYDDGDSRTSRVTTGASSLTADTNSEAEEGAQSAPDAGSAPAEARPTPDIEAQHD